MKNKLIALVEVLMVVSLLCTGYSSWAITPPDTDVQSGSMITYDVALRNLTTFGLSLSQTGANNNDKAQTFSYCTVTTGSDSTDTSTETSESGTTETTQPTSNSVTQYTNTTLSMFIKVERAKLTKWAANDYRGETLKISCKSTDGHTFASLRDYYLKLVEARLTLVGYPNLYLNVTAAIDTELTLSIPLEQIYNLVNLDKANANNTHSTLKLTLDFAEEGSNSYVLVSSDSVQNITKTFKEFNDSTNRHVAGSSNFTSATTSNRVYICNATYTFTAKLEKNQSAS